LTLRRSKEDAIELLEYLNDEGQISWQDLATGLVQAGTVDNVIENLEYIMRCNDIEDPLFGNECENQMIDAGIKAREIQKERSREKYVDVWEFKDLPSNDPRDW
jgi:hypothetical protein